MPGSPGWALDHQAEYLLLYGHDGACAVKVRNPQVDQAFSSVVNVLFSIMRRAVAADEIDTECIEAATPASLRRQLATWRDENDGGGDPRRRPRCVHDHLRPAARCHRPRTARPRSAGARQPRCALRPRDGARVGRPVSAALHLT